MAQSTDHVLLCSAATLHLLLALDLLLVWSLATTTLFNVPPLALAPSAKLSFELKKSFVLHHIGYLSHEPTFTISISEKVVQYAPHTVHVEKVEKLAPRQNIAHRTRFGSHRFLDMSILFTFLLLFIANSIGRLTIMSA